MTREDAISCLKWHKDDLTAYDTTVKEAIDMAIKALQAEPTHGRLIDADALSKKLCETTIFIKDGEVFQRIINDAPTVPVVDITQRDLCADISCTDCPFMQETCKLMDYVADAEAVQGWIPCSERLPMEKDERVLVTKRGKVRIATYSEFDGTWYVGEMCAVGGEDPIAWMPLPTPYKGGEDE